jgi:hypothetical protein
MNEAAAAPHNELNILLKIILDMVSEALDRSGERELQIGEWEVELWRWDEPTIAVTWIDADRRSGVDINKNLVVHVENNALPYNLVVEANAWVDAGESRSWEHKVIGNLTISTLRIDRQTHRSMVELFLESIKVVSTWRTSSLQRRVELPPSPYRPRPHHDQEERAGIEGVRVPITEAQSGRVHLSPGAIQGVGGIQVGQVEYVDPSEITGASRRERRAEEKPSTRQVDPRRK